MTWTRDGYLTKATLYWQKATKQTRESLDYFVYFALFTEHIVRPTLVHINPILNAARDDESVLYGAGVDTALRPKTVELSKGILLLRRIVPNITEEESKAITLLVDFRNIEFHDDQSRFDLDVMSKIVPQCQAFVIRLLDFTAVDAAAVIGEQDALNFREIGKAKAEDRIRRVKSIIDVAKDRFYHKSEEDQKKCREENKVPALSWVMNSGRHYRTHRCPACGGNGAMLGHPYGNSAPMLVDGDLVEEVRVTPNAFECRICELTISGLDELLSAQIPHEFTSLQSIDVVDHFGIDVEDYVDKEEIAQSFYEDRYGYQDE